VAAAACGLGSAAASPASVSWFYEAKALEPAASYVAGKPVRVQCAKSASGWQSFNKANFAQTGNSEHGFAEPGGTVMYVDADTCPPLLAARAGQPGASRPLLAATLVTFAHEAVHLRGQVDEGQTECEAMQYVPGVAVRFFGVKSGAQLRKLMASAWTWHRRIASDAPKYSPLWLSAQCSS
jgi:hypothetical protein